jgi:hypothetical protein
VRDFSDNLRLGATLSSRFLSGRWIRFQHSRVVLNPTTKTRACVWKVDHQFFVAAGPGNPRESGFYTGRQTLFPGCRSSSAPSATKRLHHRDLIDDRQLSEPLLVTSPTTPQQTNIKCKTHSKLNVKLKSAVLLSGCLDSYHKQPPVVFFFVKSHCRMEDQTNEFRSIQNIIYTHAHT